MGSGGRLVRASSELSDAPAGRTIRGVIDGPSRDTANPGSAALADPGSTTRDPTNAARPSVQPRRRRRDPPCIPARRKPRADILNPPGDRWSALSIATLGLKAMQAQARSTDVDRSLPRPFGVDRSGAEAQTIRVRAWRPALRSSVLLRSESGSPRPPDKTPVTVKVIRRLGGDVRPVRLVLGLAAG
jgi:hypothetical protein